MPSEQEMKFFGMLVLKGRLKKEDVFRCLEFAEESSKKDAPMGLEEASIRLKILDRARLDWLKRSDGDDLPALPGFDLKRKIGEGGTSNVYLFHEKKADRNWAVKILKKDQAENPLIRNAFVREANLLIGLDHENIVKGGRVGTVKGFYVFLMDYIDGDDVADLLRKGMTFNEDAALYIILQTARALEHMRGQSILHRDVKPGNIMLTRDNTVKLIDLGFATVIGEEPGPSDSTAGTVQFISPEQARGQVDLDIRSDIYSLGATLYQLVVGSLPFSGGDDQEIMAKQILDSLSSPALKDRAKISPHMHYFIEKMMAKEREIRYQNPAELIEHIENTIRGKKSLTYRPDMEELDEDNLLSLPANPDDPVDPEGKDMERRPYSRKKKKSPTSKFFWKKRRP